MKLVVVRESTEQNIKVRYPDGREVQLFRDVVGEQVLREAIGDMIRTVYVQKDDIGALSLNGPSVKLPKIVGLLLYNGQVWLIKGNVTILSSTTTFEGE